MAAYFRLLTAITLILAANTALATDWNDQRRCMWQDAEEKNFYDCWYVGAGYGVSVLEPDENQSGWEVTDTDDDGYKIYLGYQFAPHWFAELAWAKIGEAGVQPLNPAISGPQAIEYEVPSLMLGYYLLSPERRWNIYLKGGISAIDNEPSDDIVPFEKQTSVQFAIGAGVQWRFADSVALRLDFDSYDKDAQYLNLSLNWAFGETRSSPVLAEPAPVVITEPEVVAAAPVNPCLLPVSQQPPSCRQFNGVLEGINFANDAYQLNASAQAILQRVAEQLLANPAIRVELGAHTDSQGDTFYNKILSEKRARSVKLFLLRAGIPVRQMEAFGYGDAMPIASNQTDQGRAMNRRVEIRVIE